jgi:hypothetical protein
MSTLRIDIARGAHGVLTKNKNSEKIFISLFFNNLHQKTSCGRGTIFARGAQVRAKGRGTIYCPSGRGTACRARRMWQGLPFVAWPSRPCCVGPVRQPPKACVAGRILIARRVNAGERKEKVFCRMGNLLPMPSCKSLRSRR